MEQIGIVTVLHGDVATVAFKKKTGCGGSCGACKENNSENTIFMKVRNTENCNIGDKVVVSMKNNTFSNMTFWAYGFPTLITVITLAVTLFIFNSLELKNYELYSIILSMGAMVYSFILTKKLCKQDDEYVFKIIRVLKHQ